jgi:hypothetical protein
VTPWRRDPRLLWRRSGPRVVFLAPGTDDLRMLDGVGALVWELLEVPMEHAELLQVLGERFELPQEELDTQLTPFLTLLRDQGALIEDGAG